MKRNQSLLEYTRDNDTQVRELQGPLVFSNHFQHNVWIHLKAFEIAKEQVCGFQVHVYSYNMYMWISSIFIHCVQ